MYEYAMDSRTREARSFLFRQEVSGFWLGNLFGLFFVRLQALCITLPSLATKGGSQEEEIYWVGAKEKA